MSEAPCAHRRDVSCAWGLREGLDERIAALPPPYRREAEYLLPLPDGDCARCPINTAATDLNDERTR